MRVEVKVEADGPEEYENLKNAPFTLVVVLEGSIRLVPVDQWSVSWQS